MLFKQVDNTGKMSLTKEYVLGKSRAENVVMARCILVRMIIFAGYSVTTASLVLKRTHPAVRHLLEMGESLHKTSRAYRLAEAEATLSESSTPLTLTDMVRLCENDL